MKAYVVSLKRAEDRRTYITKHLQSLGIDFEIIDAVDYKELGPIGLANLSDTEAVSKNPCLTQGALACALSHKKINELIADRNDKYALVLEDDAALPNNIQTILRNIEHSIQSDEVISLSYYGHFENCTYLSKRNAIKVGNDATLFYPIDLHTIASSMAYVITKSAAKKMSERIVPVSVTADQWGVFFERGAFSSFRCYYPANVIPYPFLSTLNYSETASFKSKVAQFVKQYNIPILSSLIHFKYNKMIQEKHTIKIVDQQPYFAK
ncbi:hypothetical protein PK28_05775 [Hymenobacter sp. DG25B]|uniref:glycosyltransferase family 25 protein n=1 Tax=Hymenobacter sp. DG25B TaxID=1385664 RepID=UPI000540F069|nr:glycosyltransferase family 25 protein [Hymenobacter sp. DG25B]AIZ63328.1 hypothetical protein PK28_05775 [Hymenobacter sp. DG25B]